MEHIADAYSDIIDLDNEQVNLILYSHIASTSRGEIYSGVYDGKDVAFHIISQSKLEKELSRLELCQNYRPDLCITDSLFSALHELPHIVTPITAVSPIKHQVKVNFYDKHTEINYQEPIYCIEVLEKLDGDLRDKVCTPHEISLLLETLSETSLALFYRYGGIFTDLFSGNIGYTEEIIKKRFFQKTSKIKNFKLFDLEHIRPNFFVDAHTVSGNQPPELLSDDFGEIDEPTLVYKLGQVLYEMIHLPMRQGIADVRKHAFHLLGGSVEEYKEYYLIRKDIKLPDSTDYILPKFQKGFRSLNEVVDKALKRRPSDRYQTVEEFLQAYKVWLDKYHPQEA